MSDEDRPIGLFQSLLPEELKWRPGPVDHEAQAEAGMRYAVQKYGTTPPPQEVPMSDEYVHPLTGLAELAKSINAMFKERLAEPEQRFRELDVRPGDRIRLTEVVSENQHYPARSAATLEGVVRAIKVKDGVSRVQVQGFHHVGNDVWWPVTRYKVEVLHQAFRMSDEDRLLITVANLHEDYWARQTEERRQQIREEYGPRVARVRTLLGVDTDALEG